MKTRTRLFRKLRTRLIPGRYYGDGTTIHGTTYLDVETHKGEVVAVWYRCQTLPFQQTEVDIDRARSMIQHELALEIHAVVLQDKEQVNGR